MHSFFAKKAPLQKSASGNGAAKSTNETAAPLPPGASVPSDRWLREWGTRPGVQPTTAQELKQLKLQMNEFLNLNDAEGTAVEDTPCQFSDWPHFLPHQNQVDEEGRIGGYTNAAHPLQVSHLLSEYFNRTGLVGNGEEYGEKTNTKTEEAAGGGQDEEVLLHLADHGSTAKAVMKGEECDDDDLLLKSEEEQWAAKQTAFSLQLVDSIWTETFPVSTFELEKQRQRVRSTLAAECRQYMQLVVQGSRQKSELPWISAFPLPLFSGSTLAAEHDRLRRWISTWHRTGGGDEEDDDDTDSASGGSSSSSCSSTSSNFSTSDDSDFDSDDTSSYCSSSDVSSSVKPKKRGRGRPPAKKPKQKQSTAKKPPPKAKKGAAAKKTKKRPAAKGKQKAKAKTKAKESEKGKSKAVKPTSTAKSSEPRKPSGAISLIDFTKEEQAMREALASLDDDYRSPTEDLNSPTIGDEDDNATSLKTAAGLRYSARLWRKEQLAIAERERQKREQERQEKEMQKVKGYLAGTAPVTGALSNIAVVRGGTGVGKTAIAYAAAQSLGCRVLEINTSMRRTAKNIEQVFAEATKTRTLTATGSLSIVQNELFLMSKRAQEQKASSTIYIEAEETDKVKEAAKPVAKEKKESASAKRKREKEEKQKKQPVTKEVLANFFAPRKPKPVAKAEEAVEQPAEVVVLESSVEAIDVDADEVQHAKKNSSSSSDGLTHRTVQVATAKPTDVDADEVKAEVVALEPATINVSSGSLKSSSSAEVIIPQSQPCPSTTTANQKPSPQLSPTMHSPSPPANGAPPPSLPLVVVESGDVIFDDETGMHAALNRLSSESKVPVVVTVGDCWSHATAQSTFGAEVPILDVASSHPLFIGLQVACIIIALFGSKQTAVGNTASSNTTVSTALFPDSHTGYLGDKQLLELAERLAAPAVGLVEHADIRKETPMIAIARGVVRFLTLHYKQQVAASFATAVDSPSLDSLRELMGKDSTVDVRSVLHSLQFRTVALQQQTAPLISSTPSPPPRSSKRPRELEQVGIDERQLPTAPSLEALGSTLTSLSVSRPLSTAAACATTSHPLEVSLLRRRSWNHLREVAKYDLLVLEEGENESVGCIPQLTSSSAELVSELAPNEPISIEHPDLLRIQQRILDTEDDGDELRLRLLEALKAVPKRHRTTGHATRSLEFLADVYFTVKKK